MKLKEEPIMKKIIIGLAAFLLVMSATGIAMACPGEAKAKAAQANQNSNVNHCAVKTEAAAVTSDAGKAAAKTAEAVSIDNKACLPSAECPYSGAGCMTKGAKANKAVLENQVSPASKQTVKSEKSKMAEGADSKADLVAAQAK